MMSGRGPFPAHAISASVDLNKRKKEKKREHFLFLQVWVSRSTTSGSKVNFLFQSRLSYSNADGGSERTLIRRRSAERPCPTMTDDRKLRALQTNCVSPPPLCLVFPDTVTH